MVSERFEARRPWLWPAILAAAIVAGAIFGWFRSDGPPAPTVPQPNVPASTSSRPASGAAPQQLAAPAPGFPPALGAPEPPIVNAELPRAHPPPGSEPRIPSTGNRLLDQHQVLEDSAKRWADSVRGVRPEILEQMHQGKLVERERLLKEIAGLQEELRTMPGNDAITRRIETLRDNLFYLDRSITHLENIQEESR